LKIQETTLKIVVPVYNEEASLAAFREEMNQFLARTPMETTVLFVDDGSTDTSLSLIRPICRSDRRYEYRSLASNCGLSTAIKAGIDAAMPASLIGYIDADLQTTPLDFLKFLPFFPEFDMVNGIRLKRKDRFVKKASSLVANAVRRMMINDGIQDTGCPLKILKTEVAIHIPFFDGMHRFMPALVQLLGGKVKELPVHHFPRYAGQAKYHLHNRLVGPFFDTLAFIWMKKRYIRYTVSEESRCNT